VVFRVLQVAAGKVLLQRLDGSGPAATVTTNLQLASIDITDGALLLHDGWRAEVLRFNGVDCSTTLAAQLEVQGLPTQAKAADGSDSADDRAGGGVVVGAGDGRVSMALHEDSLYRTAEGRVEVCNWAGESTSCVACVAASGAGADGTCQPLRIDHTPTCKPVGRLAWLSRAVHIVHVMCATGQLCADCTVRCRCCEAAFGVC
jgi:hypothetical protein